MMDPCVQDLRVGTSKTAGRKEMNPQNQAKSKQQLFDSNFHHKLTTNSDTIDRMIDPHAQGFYSWNRYGTWKPHGTGLTGYEFTQEGVDQAYIPSRPHVHRTKRTGILSSTGRDNASRIRQNKPFQSIQIHKLMEISHIIDRNRYPVPHRSLILN